MSTASKPRRGKGEGAVYFDETTGRWIGQIDLGRDASGKRQRRKVTGKSKSEVGKKIAELRRLEAKGQSIAKQSPTVATVAAEWLAKVAPQRRAESTLSLLRGRIEDHLIPGVGQYRINQLDEPKVEKWLQAEADGTAARSAARTGKGNSLRTIQDYRGDLRQILNYALRRALVTRNVAMTSELPSNARKSAEKRSFTWEQIDALYAALEHDRLAGYFVLVAELGLRPGEADALRWDDVDLDGGVIHVRGAMKRLSGGEAVGIGEPKTSGSRRSLGLTVTATDALRKRRATQAAERLANGAVWSRDPRWTGLVFTSEIGTPVHPSNMRRSFAAACKRAGVPSLTPYELRHTRASLLVDAGATPYQVADQLGHTDTRMLDRHYRHKMSAIVSTSVDIETARRALREG